MKKINEFPKIKGRIRFNEPLRAHTTFGIGGPCAAWIEPESENALKRILKFAAARSKKVFMIGAGSNILFRDKTFNAMVIHLGGRCFTKISFSGTKVRVGAGALLGLVVSRACKKGLSGVEGLAGIPGTMAGAIFMNSGYRQTIAHSLGEIKVMDKKSGNICTLKRKNIKFGYRHSGLDSYIILEATLNLKRNTRSTLMRKRAGLLLARKETQPLDDCSAGCVFKNTKIDFSPEELSTKGIDPSAVNNGFVSSGYLIDRLGLKGFKVGDAIVSKVHANFIINLGNATAEQIVMLIGIIKQKVRVKFGIQLKEEIQLVGFDNY